MGVPSIVFQVALAASCLALAPQVGLAAGPASPTLTETTPWAPNPPAKDSAARLMEWLEKFGTQGNYLADSLLKELDSLLADVAQLAVSRSSKAGPARLALLRAAGWGLLGSQPPTLSQTIRSRAQEVLESRLVPGRGEALCNWLLFDVLASPERFEPEVRIVAVRALAGRADHRSCTTADAQRLLVGIMSAGRDGDALVRQNANESLLVRPEGFVSDYYLGTLERGELSPELFVKHLDAVQEGAPDQYAIWWSAKRLRVFAYVTRRLESKDWREASRALALAPLFELERIVPYLIQGLGVWAARNLAGQRRVVHEYAIALKSLSGRDYGEAPLVWAQWWQLATAGGESPTPPEPRTMATFFGLRPVSDRVLFVIDRSGSMRQLHEGNQSRYKDAIERLLYTLRDLGPTTQFGVVLFSNGGRSFSPELSRADEPTLKDLERWALELGPDGGTDLHSGLKAAFPGLERGEMLPSAIPYDTVVVLCDGETENPNWVAPWLARYNQTARLVFHCVNLGGQPGGVLEALSAGSGGAFIVSE